jgi:excinuclease UvrABC helicase subunit UvrB
VKKQGTKDFILTKDPAKASSGQDKVLTCFKAGTEAVTRENRRTSIMFNEMTRTNLDQMRRTLEAVFIPAFT